MSGWLVWFLLHPKFRLFQNIIKNNCYRGLFEGKANDIILAISYLCDDVFNRFFVF